MNELQRQQLAEVEKMRAAKLASDPKREQNRRNLHAVFIGLGALEVSTLLGTLPLIFLGLVVSPVLTVFALVVAFVVTLVIVLALRKAFKA